MKKKRKDHGYNYMAIPDSMPTSEELIVAGELNGHVGIERDGFKRWNGGKTHGNINEEGERILNYARECDLALVNTFFTKSDTKTYTFKSGPNQTVIDYIKIRRESISKIKDSKVIQGKSVASQHQLLVVEILAKKNKRRFKKRKARLAGGNSESWKGKNS